MDTYQGRATAVATAMIILPTIAVLLRLWSRALVHRTAPSPTTRFWWDDWAAVMAAVLNVALCGMGLGLVQLGLGLHAAEIPEAGLEAFLKVLWSAYWVFDAGTATAKASALLFYTRVFGNASSRFTYALWVVHFLNVAWFVGFAAAAIGQCYPLQASWSVSEASCVNVAWLWVGSGVTSLVIDVAILLLPLVPLWKLEVELGRKLLIVGVFLCGYLVVVVSIGCLVSLVQIGPEVRSDPTYAIASAMLWLGCEIGISITSISLPSLFVLARCARQHGVLALIGIRASEHDADSRRLDAPCSTTATSPHRSPRIEDVEMGPASSIQLATPARRNSAVDPYIEAIRTASQPVWGGR